MTGAGETLAISGWGVISAIGIGPEAFGAALRAGQCGCKRVEGGADGALPTDLACTVPEFEPARFLGPKGTRVMDRTTGLAVAATGMALAHSGVTITRENEDRVGMVLGTSNGSMRSTFEYTRETLGPGKPYLVSPELFPNTVMNCAAGQCAIWHNLKALNPTISGGRLAGVLALRYARRMLRSGYADLVLAGAVEEFCPELAWGSFLATASRTSDRAVLGEGAAIFALESRQAAEAAGRTPRAEVLACEAAV